MSHLLEHLSLPLRETQEGVILIEGTRVPLDTVIRAFVRGDSPEAILRGYPTLNLADVYAVIAFYLRKRPQVDAYLAKREKQAEEVHREIDARSPADGLRERVQARRAGKESPDAPVLGG